MTGPEVALLGLLTYSVLMGGLGHRLLDACRGAYLATPRLGLLLWLLTSTSWVVAVLSAGLAAVAELTDGYGLAALLHACLWAVRVMIAPHAPAEFIASAALLCSLLMAARVGGVAGLHRHRTRRHRRAHLTRLRGAPLGTGHDGGLITLVDSATPAAYCVPGRDRTIVVSTGAVRALSPAELRAVLAHESAHLRGHHTFWLGVATVLAQAFAFVPLLRATPAEVARLVEWIADDGAARRHGDRIVAGALAAMAITDGPRSAPRSPASTLAAAGGSDVPERVRRLLRRRAMTRRAYRGYVAVLALPVLALAVAAGLLLPAATADPVPLGGEPPTASGASFLGAG